MKPLMNARKREKPGTAFISVHPRSLAVFKKPEPRINANKSEYKKSGSAFISVHPRSLAVILFGSVCLSRLVA
jgi:hypothetical protein